MKKKMEAVKKAGGKMKPLTMKQFEGSKEDKKADAAGLKKMNEKRKGGK